MRAVMLEVLRVLAGYESSWGWNEGTDKERGRGGSETPHKIRSPVQIDGRAHGRSVLNSMALAPELKNLVFKRVGSLNAPDFQRAMKRDHHLAMEYISRLLRRTITQNGPVLRHTAEIDRWLRKDAVQEFRSLRCFSIQPQDDHLPRFRH